MAYKKYIVKNGKVYGPYVYHSRRVNGKVVSEYRGTNKKLKYKNFGFMALGIIVLAILIFLAVNYIEIDRTITGQAVLDLEANYQEGKILDGTLKLSLEKEDLIPVSSKIVFKNLDNNYEYDLSEFADLNEIKKETSYPEVFFTLNIISSTQESEEPAEETTEEPVEEIQEEVTEEEIEEPVEETTEESIEEKPTLGMTGNLILELDREIQGQVKYGEEFIYELSENELVELASGSVKTEEKELGNNEINLEFENNSVIVTTEYYEELEEEYLNQKELIINLSELGLLFEKGDLEVLIIYGEEEIVSLRTALEEDQIIDQEVVSEVKEEEIQEEVNQEEIKELIKENISEEIQTFETLTTQEKEILLNEFGDLSVNITKSEAINNRLIIRNELGDFWVEYSYDLELSSEEIENQIELDRIKWLKDIVKILTKEETESQEVENFLGEVDI